MKNRQIENLQKIRSDLPSYDLTSTSQRPSSDQSLERAFSEEDKEPYDSFIPSPATPQPSGSVRGPGEGTSSSIARNSPGQQLSSISRSPARGILSNLLSSPHSPRPGLPNSQDALEVTVASGKPASSGPSTSSSDSSQGTGLLDGGPARKGKTTMYSPPPRIIKAQKMMGRPQKRMRINVKKSE